MRSPNALATCLLSAVLFASSSAAHAAWPAAPGAHAPAALTLPDPRPPADAVAGYGGLIRALVATDDALYMAQGFRIEAASLEDPEHPRFMSTVAFSETVVALAITPGGLLVAGVGRRLVVLDVAHPLRPAIVGEIAFDDLVEIVEPDPTRALVYVSHWAGLEIIDLATPGAPRLIATIGGPPVVVAAGEGVLYATSNSGIAVVDTRDPRAPLTVAIEDEEQRIDFVSHLARDDDTLYAVHRDLGSGTTRIVAFDLADPLRPTKRRSRLVDAPYVHALVVRDGWLIHTSIEPSSGQAWLEVLGGRTSAYELGRVAQVSVSTQGPAGVVAVHGGAAYVAASGSGLVVLRWQPERFESHKIAEIPIASTLPLASMVSFVDVSGSGAVVTTGAGETRSRLDRVLLTDPAAPRPESFTPLSDHPIAMVGTAYGAAMSVRDEPTGPPRLRLWHAAASTAALSDPVPGVFSASHLAYDARTGNVVAAGQGDPWSILWTVAPDGSVCAPCPPTGLHRVAAIAADDGRMLALGTVGDGDVGVLRTFDDAGRRLGETGAAIVLGTGGSHAAAMDGPAAYVAGRGLQVFDIADLSAPQRVHHEPADAAVGRAAIAIAGNLMAVADGPVTLYDVTARFQPRPLVRWTMDEIWGAQDVAILGANVLVAADGGGLLVLPIRPTDLLAANVVFAPAVMVGSW